MKALLLLGRLLVSKSLYDDHSACICDWLSDCHVCSDFHDSATPTKWANLKRTTRSLSNPCSNQTSLLGFRTQVRWAEIYTVGDVIKYERKHFLKFR